MKGKINKAKKELKKGIKKKMSNIPEDKKENYSFSGPDR
ncbi:hypothetical protein UNSWDHB_980 [Dehalobacter sp. UNSWDHB]|jgi:hypothetical protein|nr:hypothetical protein DHBDCA_p2779 [Dehalobacter sp. DCA]AFV06788.1 hypothetical protein DCF50_p2785 [Dehalobacter sp. CF]EQB21667.1 hypothetical protein UNSWDHB_980 [Dehalobacter sp. UNSWDHB]